MRNPCRDERQVSRHQFERYRCAASYLLDHEFNPARNNINEFLFNTMHMIAANRADAHLDERRVPQTFLRIINIGQFALRQKQTFGPETPAGGDPL